MDDLEESSTTVSRAGTDETDGGALEATGAYETATAVVLYDTEDPLAWVQGDNAVRLDEMN